MALSVVKRPPSFKITGTSTLAAVTNSSGTALFTANGHGMSTGNYLYMKGPFSNYNGFWYVNVIGVNTFTVREYATSTDVTYTAAGNVNWQLSAADMGETCAHLPIVYKLKSDKWPINTTDTARTVSSFSNSNGYTSLVLSGDIKASGSADALEQVKISGTAALDGVYKILFWSSDINFVIDLAYSSTNAFGIGTVQYFYGNYHAVIKIYAGIDSSHSLVRFGGFTLVGTIEQQPDPSGIVTVNINEFIKKKIDIPSNNLQLDSLPNNINAWTKYFISYAESYDDANQYGTNDLNVSQYTSPFTSEEFVYNGLAVNSKLPFKNIYSGGMGAYTISAAGTGTQKFLTGFTSPVMWADKYFDLSFIVRLSSTHTVRRELYQNGVLIATVNDTLTNLGQGVYRYPIYKTSTEDRIDVTLLIAGTAISETLTITVDSECSAQDFYVTWLNSLGGYDYWNFKAETQYGTDVIESKTQEKNIYSGWPKSYGELTDAVTQQTIRRTKDSITLNSQYLDSDQMDGLALIFESLLVQEMNSVYDRRNIILQGGAFNKKIDNQKLLMVTTQGRYTDENPSQSL